MTFHKFSMEGMCIMADIETETMLSAIRMLLMQADARQLELIWRVSRGIVRPV